MKLWEFNGQGPGITQEAAVRTVFFDAFRANCTMIEHLEWYAFTGSSDEPVKDASATGGGTRALNNDWVADATTPDYGALSLKIFGDAIKTDSEHQVRGTDIGDEHIRQLKALGESMGRDFQNRMVNSTASSTNWAGFKSLTPTAANITEFELGSGNGLVVALGNSDAARQAQQQLIETLLIISRSSTFMLMDERTRSRLISIGMGFVNVTTTMDVLGNPIELTTFNGKPIVISGQNGDESADVLPFNNTVGTSSNCGEIYGVRCGEKAHFTMGTNVGFRVEGPVKVKNSIETTINLSVGSERLSGRALKRITGLRLNS